MSLSKDQDVVEFQRIIEELSEFTESMTPYERQFVEDNAARVEKFEEKTHVSEAQLIFSRKLYDEYC